MARDANMSSISAPMFNPQQISRLQDNHHSQKIKAQTPPPSIFDCTSDDDLSDAPSPSPPEYRPLPVVSQVRVADSLASDTSSDTDRVATLETSTNKLVHPEPAREARSPLHKRRKTERTAAKAADMRERPSSNLPRNARHTQRTPNTYQGTRKLRRPLNSTGSIDDGKILPSPTDFDDIPSARPHSKQQPHQKIAIPKMRGRPPRRNAPRRDGHVSRSNITAHNQERNPTPNSPSTLKHPTRRIMSDLEPALSQSIARPSLRTPTSSRNATLADATQKLSDQNSLEDDNRQDPHDIRSLPASTAPVDLTSGHQPASNSQVADPISPTSFDDATLVQGGEIPEVRPSTQKVHVQPFLGSQIIVRTD